MTKSIITCRGTAPFASVAATVLLMGAADAVFAEHARTKPVCRDLPCGAALA